MAFAEDVSVWAICGAERQVRVSYRASSQSVWEGCQAGVSHKSVKLERSTKVSSLNVSSECSSKSVLQDCQERVSHKSVKSECPAKVSRRSVPQKCVKSECPTRVWRNSAKSVCQVGVSRKCPENVTRVVFVYQHTCQHSISWVSSCLSHMSHHCFASVVPVFSSVSLKGGGFIPVAVPPTTGVAAPWCPRLPPYRRRCPGRGRWSGAAAAVLEVLGRRIRPFWYVLDLIFGWTLGKLILTYFNIYCLAMFRSKKVWTIDWIP